MDPRTKSLHQQAVALHEAGRFGEALAVYDQALLQSPDAASVHFGRAMALWMLGRREEAIAAYDAAIVLMPAMTQAHYNRAVSLQHLNRLDEALAGFDAALALQPNFAGAWNNRAGALQALDRPREALESVERLLALQPGHAAGYYNRGTLLLLLDRYEEAAASFERALALKPDHPDALGCLASAALKSCDWPRMAELAPRVLREMASGKAVLSPLILLNFCDDPAAQKICAQINLAVDLAKANAPARPTPLWTGEAYGHDRIRLAYMSSDFRVHPVGFQIAELLERHDRARFEITGIFTGRDDGSAIAKRIALACDRFVAAAEESDDALARKIREMEIDMLVDLNGQTQGWRPAVFRYRPAPIQATWLGFAGTMGADFMDYVIADSDVAPHGDQAFFSEKIVHLPDSFWPAVTALPPGSWVGDATRAGEGLPESGFVFCCFNNHWKISDAMFQVWMRLLLAVPGSVLWLRQGPEPLMRTLRREAARHGVDPVRLVGAARTDTAAQHVRRHRLADLFLDTFPYNAHATAADALSAGLPLVTLRGKSFVSRVASSLLNAASLPELVTQSLADYEALALALAKDPARLAGLRRKLEAAKSGAPLFDPDRFARGFEAVLLANCGRTGTR